MEQQASTGERWGQRTATGRDEWISVITRWSDERDAWITDVSERRGAAWCPLEFHASATEAQAQTTHRRAARRHPKSGNYRTEPRGYGADDRCTRCGEHYADAHDPKCRD